MKKSELFTARVNETDVHSGRRLSRIVVVKKGTKHWVDSQRVMYNLETGFIIDANDERPEVFRPRLSVDNLQPIADSGIPGCMILHKMTHNVRAIWFNRNTMRNNTCWIHVRTNKRHAIDIYGRRYNKLTGECIDDKSLSIDIKTVKPWEPIYV